jgi:prepilin-type processing-associated H-X9-DG protein
MARGMGGKTRGEGSMKHVLLGGALVLGALGVLAGLAYLPGARDRAIDPGYHRACQSNLRQLALGALMYAADCGGALPDPVRWRAQLDLYVKNPMLYDCPHAAIGPYSRYTYAMNRRLRGGRIGGFQSPAEVVLFYEMGTDGQPATPHNGGMYCAFLDGHVGWVKGVPPGL